MVSAGGDYEVGPRVLHILHFNDVYNVEEKPDEPRAGAARFVTALREHGGCAEGLVLFSGDALNPSTVSAATQGRHMPDILNQMNITCAVVGNHDFDFGLEVLEECMAKTNFAWLNSNAFDIETGRRLGDTLAYKVVDHSASRLRIGLIGLVEEEWISTLSCLEPSAVHVVPFCQMARDLARQLKRPLDEGGLETPKCDLVIALTHMRWPNDRLLAQNVPEIDLVLGGHDHDYGIERISIGPEALAASPEAAGINTPHERVILKSGTDFRQFSHLRLYFDPQKRLQQIHVEEVTVDSRWTPDPKVGSCMAPLARRMRAQLQLLSQTFRKGIDDSPPGLAFWIARGNVFGQQSSKSGQGQIHRTGLSTKLPLPRYCCCSWALTFSSVLFMALDTFVPYFFQTAELVAICSAKMMAEMDSVIGQIDVDLDSRFWAVRTRETNIGNLICDIILAGVEADCALLNSGTFRADKVIPAGPFRLRDLNALLPMFDPIVVLRMTGAQLLNALENSVSEYPKLEGQ
ncbi:unnamed protein product [Protopolystoma xenopodis]|uniref:Calcineurin-like phosphoesterase domain-containing protein n=1 Tax=Protopolystoma xenopodis TaxID=117903 RepID=A0A3S5CC59_9PLAT|nr:unnamed protein product [Protopolystoma xenopodis]